ncbi:hypothetical protein Cgig2_022051 [Carnegiea gigantea]|uniref:B3 domain-containing protein n=1 Tax=Carnegiea gigantea TaxID=171969 RepID=A0A9Q1QMR0_9CARY|nr:hypothetical protein Cgig2_022051 [Carnegiea gigantea]
MRLFGVVIFSGNSTVNEDGGGSNFTPQTEIERHKITMPNTSNSNHITNPNITCHYNHHQLHDTKQVLKLFGKVISQLSTHDHQDQTMDDNKIPKSSRKRERSWSSSASAITTASLEEKPKKERSLRPSKEEISKAHVTFPLLPPQIHQKMTTLGFDPNDEKSKPMLILQKLVTKTDVDNHQARLLIPKGQLLKGEEEFLDAHELKKLNEGNGEIKVMVVQRSMEANDREMPLALWPSPQRRKEIKEAGGREPSVRYSLQGEWNQIKTESSINEKDVVQVWAFSTGNSPVNEHGGGSNISMPNTTNSNFITNPNATHHHTKKAFKLFGKIISQLSTHNHHDHHDNHQDQRMENNIPKSSRKRERSCSSSASTTTTASLPKKTKKERSSRPSKEEISNAHITFPFLSPQIHQKMTALGFDPNDETSEPMLILQKLVTKTDVDNRQARLLIPKAQLLKSEDEFLDDQELKKLNEGDGQAKVMVIQRPMEVRDREMTLTLWPTPQRREKIKEAGEREPSQRYLLQGEWNEVKSESGINEKDVVQVWAFRYGEETKLGFAVVNLGPMNELKIC